MSSTELPYFIHPTATVAAGAQIGAGCRIWHYCHIMEGARIGPDCSLGQNVFVGRNVVIGEKAKIQNNVSLYEGVELERGVFCGPSVVFTNVRHPRALVERKAEFHKTLIREGATLGANCTILCGNEIGRYAFVGAGAVVTRSVPSYALVVGVPASLKGHACECGEVLSFGVSSLVSCPRCSKTYQKVGKDEVSLLGGDPFEREKGKCR